MFLKIVRASLPRLLQKLEFSDTLLNAGNRFDIPFAAYLKQNEVGTAGPAVRKTGISARCPYQTKRGIREPDAS